MKPNNIERQLAKILQEYPDTIKAHVAQEAVDYGEIESFFEDLRQNGCISGMITSLIYYSDTHQFFDRHYHEIEEIRNQYEGNIGTSLITKEDLKNFLAWFAFEETASQLSIELGVC